MRPTLAAILLSPLTLCAQRDDPSFEWQKRSTTIEYGVVPVGEHGLDELPVGGTWRLGMNEASRWRLEMPILAGDVLLPPGDYRCNLRRTAAATAALALDGSHLATGANADAAVTGAITAADKATKKLEIEWQQAGGAAAGNQPAAIVVQFGDSTWRGDVTVLGGRSFKVRGGALTLFHVPKAQLAPKHGGVVIGVLGYGKAGSRGNWNLVVDGDEARFVPWMTAPTAQFGFGEVAAPDAELVTSGTAAIAAADDDADHALLQAAAVEQSGDGLRVAARFGTKVLTLELPAPRPRKTE